MLRLPDASPNELLVGKLPLIAGALVRVSAGAPEVAAWRTCVTPLLKLVFLDCCTKTLCSSKGLQSLDSQLPTQKARKLCQQLKLTWTEWTLGKTVQIGLGLCNTLDVE